MSVNQKPKGFITVMLVLLLSFMMLAFSGLFLMGLGIKNFTKAQAACLTANLNGQKKLARLLERLLSLNKKSKSLNRQKKAIQWAKVLALSSGNMPAYLVLKKSLKVVKYRQNRLLVEQAGLILKSRKVKLETLKNFKTALARFKVRNTKENTFFKKALAVRRERIGAGAYIYTPVKNFLKQQSTVFSWRMNPLDGAEVAISLGGFLGSSRFFGKYNCAATLERSGNKWKARLTK